MMVQNWMTKDVIALDIEDPVRRASELLMDKGLQLLPVRRQGKLVGVVTRCDLKRLTGKTDPELCLTSPGMSELKAKDIMTREPITIPPDYTIEEAAEVIVERHIPGCPVLDQEGRIVGVITKADILKALVSAPGITRIGVVFGIQAQESEGCVTNVLSVIRKYGAQLMAVWSSYANAPDGYRNIYVRIVHRDPSIMKNLEQELSSTCKLLFVVDRKNDRRDVFAPGTAVP